MRLSRRRVVGNNKFNESRANDLSLSTHGPPRARNPGPAHPGHVDGRLCRAAAQPGAPGADGSGRRSRTCRRSAALGRLVSAPRWSATIARSFDQESPADFPARRADGVVRYPHLALSGGGANGAFGAGLPERLVGDREPPGLQDRHRRVDRRADGALRVPRTAIRRRAARVLHDHLEPRHLRRRVDPDLAPAWRIPRRHRTAHGADRAARHAEFLRKIADAHKAAGASTSARSTSIRGGSSFGTWV